jgi:hypothetical protein
MDAMVFGHPMMIYIYIYIYINRPSHETQARDTMSSSLATCIDIRSIFSLYLDTYEKSTEEPIFLARGFSMRRKLKTGEDDTEDFYGYVRRQKKRQLGSQS